MKTKSFTLRMPIDLLEEVEKRSGRGKRSEFIVQTLRDALGVESVIRVENPEVSKKVEVLELELEFMKTRLAQMDERLAEIEKVPAAKPVAAENADSKRKTESNTDSKTGLETLPLEIPDETPENSRVLNGKELLNILRKEDPERGWDVHKLRNKRQHKAANHWHTVNNCRFIYKGKGAGEGRKQSHEWFVIHPVEATPSSS